MMMRSQRHKRQAEDDEDEKKTAKDIKAARHIDDTKCSKQHRIQVRL